MKKLFPLFILPFFISFAFSQTSLVNFKEGTWKNKQSWLYQQIPADTNDVVLMHDIVVDTNAICRSLTTNGYNVIVANGFNLRITGRDTIGNVPDNDTLISEIRGVYYGDSEGGEKKDVWFLRYEYDELKRVSKKLENYDDEVDIRETRFFYVDDNPLPYKTIYYDPCYDNINNICHPKHDTSYYTYNNDGLVIKDSSSAFSTVFYPQKDWRTITYIINSDSITEYLHTISVSKYQDDNGEEQEHQSITNDTTYYHTIRENGNIVYQTDSSTFFGETSRHICTYDKKINPLYKTTIHLPVLPYEQLVFEGPEQKNNTISNDETYTYLEYSRQKIYKSAFKYKPNNYPREWFLLDNYGFLTMLEYKYTK